jgi:SAM-dependent methyltransferase
VADHHSPLRCRCPCCEVNRRIGLHDSNGVAHARTVLVNVPDPEAVLAEMTRLVRPGGWVASLEPDVAVHLYHPANPAWDRLHEIFIAAVQADGVDPFIGRRLPELFREAGLSDIGVRAHTELYPPGHTRRTIRLDLVRRCGPRSWRWASPASKNLTIWIVPHANISTILTPWFSLICSSWPGAANPRRDAR